MLHSKVTKSVARWPQFNNITGAGEPAPPTCPQIIADIENASHEHEWLIAKQYTTEKPEHGNVHPDRYSLKTKVGAQSAPDARQVPESIILHASGPEKSLVEA